MLPQRVSLRVSGAAAGWRRLVAYVLIAFMVYAPLAEAACEIEHFATLAQAAGQVDSAAPAAAPVPNPSSDDRNQCCPDDATAVMAQSRVAQVDVVSLASPDFRPTQIAVRPAAPSRPVIVMFTGFRPPPPEPVFRRVPKLRF